MTISAGYPIPPGRDSASRNLHPQIWRRLREGVARRSGAGAGTLLFGPAGVGKSILLRRLYWDLFFGQDSETPLIVSVPLLPFQPHRWARRFLAEVCQQWVAFERRDAELAQSNLLPVSDLIDVSNRARLFPLAQTLDDIRKMEVSAENGVFVLEWAFEAVNQAALRLRRPALLMVDGPENAFWGEEGETFHLTQIVRPQEAAAEVRRVWAMRRGSPAPHPFLAPIPAGTELLAMEALGDKAAQEFISALAAERNLDYDDRVLNEFLPLWGGIPRYLENFVRKSTDVACSLISPARIVQAYLDDLGDGPSARDLEASLNPPTGEAFDPADLARAIDACLLLEGASYTSGGAEEKGERILRRLAQAGFAVYDQGEWRAPSVPILADFLRLFAARNSSGQDMASALAALKRRRLVDAPLAAEKSQATRNLESLRLLLEKFQGQNIPAHLLHAHRTTKDSGADAASVGTETFHLPWCIRAFDRIQPSALGRGAPPPIPAVVGWCFEEPTYLRGDEMLWVAYACDHAVVTTEEVAFIERSNKQIGREFGVGRVIAWIVTDSRFSPEAVEELNARGYLVSSRAGCEATEGLLGEASGKRTDEPASQKTEGESTGEILDAVEKASPSPAVPVPVFRESQAEARIVEARPMGSLDQVVELRLPPRADMELVAASTLEQLAASCGFSEKAIGQMKMAILEACLNAIERSRNREKEVRVRLEANPHKFTVLVENEGETFDPLAVEDPRIEDKLGQSYKRGWGLKLIRKFMDRVVFEPYDRGTRLRMEKMNVPPGSPEEIARRSEI